MAGVWERTTLPCTSTGGANGRGFLSAHRRKDQLYPTGVAVILTVTLKGTVTVRFDRFLSLYQRRIDVRRSRRFEEETDELATAGYSGVVDKLVLGSGWHGLRELGRAVRD